MKEGQDEIYYVTADTLRRGEEQPAARDLPQEGHRGAAADRPRRRMGGRATCTEFDGKPLRVGRQGRARPRQARGRGREEAAEEAEAGEFKELARAR